MSAAALRHSRDLPDLAPRAEAPVEWWFVQGHVDGPKSGRRHVMAAFFLVRGPRGEGPPGAMLIQHVIGPEGGPPQVESRLGPPVIAHHDRIARSLTALRFPPLLRDLALWRHRRDMQAMVGNAGLIVDDSAPEIGTDPFRVAWNGFALEALGGGLALRLPLGAGGGPVALHLTPQSPWLTERSEALNHALGPAYTYYCCPRFALTGSDGGEALTGQVWIDRQWCSYDGLLLQQNGSGTALLGWDWFGLNLSDGRDLLLYRHRNAGEMQPFASYAVLFEDGIPHLTRQVEATPLRHWTSPNSGAIYPLGWIIALPEIGLEAELQPLRDDQEIPVFGLRAIWEGAAELRGAQAGRALRGSGRMELVGYGAVLSVAAHVRHTLSRLGAGFRRRR